METPEDQLLRDIAFPLPHDIAAMNDVDREQRAKISSDICAIDRRRMFIRGVLEVPVTGSDEPLRFGVWAEVPASTAKRHIELYRVDARAEPPASGLLANTVRGYPSTLGLPLSIRFGTAKDRPRLVLDPSDHPLVLEQRDGIDLERLEVIVHRALTRPTH